MLVIQNEETMAEFYGCAFVPTMGALHQGHLSLIETGKNRNRPVLVSIFVNPTQFSPHEDFDAYPRDLDRDLALLEDAGADAVFAPSHETVYPEVPTHIALPEVATKPNLEDASRPTHFQGVCAVVSRLFDLVKPSVAVFGEKDFQQLQVIKKFVEEDERWEGLEIVCSPIIREEDGLAMSSRNVYLSESQRSNAAGLAQAIRCKDEHEMCSTIESAGFDVDYAVLRDAQTLLAPIDGRPVRALVAARAGDIRLIDNGPVTL